MNYWVYRNSRIVLSKNKEKKNTYSYYRISLFFPPFLLIFHLFGRFPLPYFILLSFFSCFTSHFRILGYRSSRGTLNSRWIKNSNRSNAGLRWKISKKRLNSPTGWWLFRFFSFSVEIYGRFAAWYKCDRKPRWRKGKARSLIYERNRKSSTNVLPFVPLFVPSQRWVRLKGVHCDLAAPREKLDRIFQSDRFNFCSSSVLRRDLIFFFFFFLLFSIQKNEKFN